MIEAFIPYEGDRDEFPFSFMLSRNLRCDLVVAFDRYSNMAFIIPPGVRFKYWPGYSQVGTSLTFPGPSRLGDIEYVRNDVTHPLFPVGSTTIPTDSPTA